MKINAPFQRAIFNKTEDTFYVRVIRNGNLVFTPDTKEEYEKSMILRFNKTEANTLVSGGGIDVSHRIINLN